MGGEGAYGVLRVLRSVEVVWDVRDIWGSRDHSMAIKGITDIRDYYRGGRGRGRRRHPLKIREGLGCTRGTSGRGR